MSELRFEPRVPLNIGDEYAQWLVDLKYEDIPADVIHRAKRHILDTVACMLAGRHTLTITDKLLDDMEPDCGPCTIIGTDKKTTMRGAAYLNGISAQVHDFNDGLNNCGMYGGTYHPGREVVPCALAAAEALGCSGKELITAVVVGFETSGRIRNTKYAKSALVDGFAVACACAKLMGADAEQMKLAMSHGTNIAPIFNGGDDHYESNYTGWGHVASLGIIAAQLGMKRTSAPVWNDSQSGSLRYASRGLGQDWFLRDTYFKPWPSCRKTHGAIACALEYVHTHGIKAEQIDKVKVYQQHVGMYVNQPLNDLQDFEYQRKRQFSIQYTAACAFIDGTVDLRHFRGPIKPEILEFSKKISVTPDNALDGHNEISPNHAAMDLYLTDGTVRSIYVQYPLGSEPNAMSDEQLNAKLRHCAEGILSPEAAEQLIGAIWALDDCEKVSCKTC